MFAQTLKSSTFAKAMLHVSTDELDFEGGGRLELRVQTTSGRELQSGIATRPAEVAASSGIHFWVHTLRVQTQPWDMLRYAKASASQHARDET